MMHPIIITSSDTACCNSILSNMNAGDSPCTVAGIATNRETLARLLNDGEASIIIIDCVSLKDECMDLIRLVRSNYGWDLMILALGPRDFSCIYQAVHAGADDYLLIPVYSKDLHRVLSSLCGIYEKRMDRENMSRRLFLSDTSISVINDRPLTLRQLNNSYNTHFKEGFFQMLFIKFDSSNSFDELTFDITPLIDDLRGMLTDHFKEDCADIVYEAKKDGLMVLMNYESDKKSSVSAKIPGVYNRAANLMQVYGTADTTVGVSAPVNSPNKIGEIKKQVRDTEWLRMHYGLNKLIYWRQNTADVDGSAQLALEPIMSNTVMAIDSLNINKFKIALFEFYSLASGILISRSAQTFIRKIISRIYQTYWNTINEFTDPTESYDSISYCLHLCTSFEQHKRTLIYQCSDLMEEISAHSRHKYSPAVSQVLAYVMNNVDKPVLLEDAAAEVNLSTGYLSSLFKKETGTNFTKYVGNHKNSVACELLKNSSLNISEIAYQTGFPDVRAFSKKFHVMNGISPSEYRKLHAKKNTQIL